MSRAMKIVLFVLVAFVVLVVVPLAVIWQLLFGWAFYLGRVIPAVRMQPGGVVLGMACLVGVAVLGHWLAGWLWREMGPATAPRWRLRWTAISLGIVVLMFVCGISATGVAHQTGWLLRSEERMFTRVRPTIVRIHCGSDMRQIGLHLREYAKAHDDRLPDSLAALHADAVYLDMVCPSQPGLAFVYYGRGLTWPASANVPILAEPLANHEGEGMNILFDAGEVRFVSADEAQAILAERLAGNRHSMRTPGAARADSSTSK